MPFVVEKHYTGVEVVHDKGQFRVDCPRCGRSRPFGRDAEAAKWTALKHSTTRHGNKCIPL